MANFEAFDKMKRKLILKDYTNVVLIDEFSFEIQLRNSVSRVDLKTVVMGKKNKSPSLLNCTTFIKIIVKMMSSICVVC